MADIRMTMPMYRRRTVSVDGKIIKLTPRETEIVSILLARRGKFTDWHDLAWLIWQGENEPDRGLNLFAVFLTHLRRKGVPIGGSPARGLWI